MPILFQRLSATLAAIAETYEIVFVNDGSHDRSIALIIELAQRHTFVKYIDFSRNFGHQVAVSAGLDYAQGEAIAIIDADLQDPPEFIGDLYRKMTDGYEVVYARRKSREGESWLKKLTAKYFYRILARITSVEIPVDTGDFRIMDRQVADVLKAMPERHKYLRGQISWIGFNQTFLEFDRAERHAGETGYTYRKMLRFALDGVTAFSNFPLKIISFLGFAVVGFGVLTTIYALVSRYIWEDYVQGWTSLMIAILFIGGAQMIAIGIIGEYLSRINSDVRQRPLYIVRETNVRED